MNSVHQKSPFIFFSILFVVFLSALGYIYVRNHPTSPSANIVWVDGSIKITTNAGGCSPTFPCYETYFLNGEGTILHNDESVAKTSEAKSKTIINEALGIYTRNTCTPFYGTDKNSEKENYELVIDGVSHKFGNDKGCREMQDVLKQIQESI